MRYERNYLGAGRQQRTSSPNSGENLLIVNAKIIDREHQNYHREHHYCDREHLTSPSLACWQI